MAKRAELEKSSRVARVTRPNSSVAHILRLAMHSSVRFVRLIADGCMRLNRESVGRRYEVDGTYEAFTYEVFRDTECDDGTASPPTVLIVGFRLRWIGSNELLHWAFQRICILTTPFWSGFPGFRVKLWMVDPQSKDYLGIYEWAGAENAQRYVDWLVNILLPLSTKGSVWFELRTRQGLDTYLTNHMIPSLRRSA